MMGWLEAEEEGGRVKDDNGQSLWIWVSEKVNLNIVVCNASKAFQAELNDLEFRREVSARTIKLGATDLLF